MKTNYIKILISMFIAGAVALQPMTNYAQDGSGITGNPQDDAAFTCASAINVMDCIKQTQDPASQAQQVAVDNLKTAIPISNQTFGFTGPISFNVRYDQDLSWILDAGYVQKFGNRAAAALKVSAGPNEYRGNSTIGLLITPKQQIKLTYEFLTQNLPFDYASGKVNQWVNQNAYGAAYRYMLGNSVLQAVELSASYTKAHSKELSDAYIYGSGGQITDINERRIAGGQQAIGMASVVLTPFKNTIIKIGGGYSQSRFDTKWDSDQATSAIAYNVEASRLLTPKTMLSTGVTSSATERAHTLKLSRILPGNIEGNVTGQYSFSNVQGISNYGSVTAGLSYPAPKTYTNMFSGGIGDLKSWVSQPVIYNTRVLAIAEERLISVAIGTKQIPGVNLPVNVNFENVDKIETQDYFTYNKDAFDKIDYSIATYLKSDLKTPVDLKLQMTPLDSYNYKVTSSAPLPATAVNNAYTAIISANGYRKGAVISQANNSFDLTGQTNPSAPSGQWVKNNINPATPGQNDYNSGPLANNIGNGLSGDQYTFTIVNTSSDDSTYVAPDWLTLSSDGQSLVNKSNKTVPVTLSTPVKIIVSAISKATGNPVYKPNTQDSNQTFMIDVSTTNFQTPEWIKQGSTLIKLPDATQGVDYSTKNVNLNPYNLPANLTPYTTPTTNGINVVDDVLTFSLLKQGTYCDWLTLSGATPKNGDLGTLTGIPVIKDNGQPYDCTVTVQVISQVVGGPPRTFKDVQTIHVGTPNYAQPDWTKTGLNVVDASINKNYSVALNPYTTTNTYLSRTWNSDLNSEANDKIVSFSTNLGTKCVDSSGKSADGSWLKINDEGVLNSPNGIPDSASGYCDITVTYTTQLLGTRTTKIPPPAGRIIINSPKPVWQMLNPSINIPYTSISGGKAVIDITGIPIGSATGTKPYLNNGDNKDYMSNVNINPLSLGPNPSWSQRIAVAPTCSVQADNINHCFVTVNNITADDAVPTTTPTNTSYQGSFSASAVKGDSAPSDLNLFTFTVTNALKAPEASGVALPTGTFNSAYAPTTGYYSLNPYDTNAQNTNGSTAVLKKTRLADGTTSVNDTLTFALDPNSECKTYAPDLNVTPSGSNAGQISGTFTSTSGTGSCQLSFTVLSDKIGGTPIPFNLPIKINDVAPKWNITSGTIPFDITSVSSSDPKAINLNNMLTQPNSKNLTFTFASSSGHDNWDIISGNTSYLVRKKVNNAIDALDIKSANISVPIKVSNANNDSDTAALAITVTADPTNIKTVWKPSASTSLVANPTTNKYSFPITDYLQTQLVADNTPVNDQFYMNDQSSSGANNVVCTGPTSSGKVTINNSGTTDSPIYSIEVPTNLATDSYGVYPNQLNPSNDANVCGSNQLRIQNFRSLAGGVNNTRTLNLDSDFKASLTIGGQLTLNTTATQQIMLDALDYQDKNSIYLNPLLTVNPVNAGLVKFNITTNSARWKIEQSGNDWYLSRATEFVGGKNTIDVSKTTLASDPAIITLSANDMPSNDVTINAKILPDPNGIQLKWYSEEAGKLMDAIYIRIQGNGQSSGNTPERQYFLSPNDSTVLSYKKGGNNTTPISDGVIFLRSCLKSDENCSTLFTNDQIKIPTISGKIWNTGCGSNNTFDSSVYFSSPSSNNVAALSIIQYQVNYQSIPAQCNVTIPNSIKINSTAQGTVLNGNVDSIKIKICPNDYPTNTSLYAGACKDYLSPMYP